MATATKPRPAVSPPQAPIQVQDRGAINFGVRLPVSVMARIDETRWRLRLPSRNRVIELAVLEWLQRHESAA